jgi:hypothetical protein
LTSALTGILITADRHITLRDDPCNRVPEVPAGALIHRSARRGEVIESAPSSETPGV